MMDPVEFKEKYPLLTNRDLAIICNCGEQAVKRWFYDKGSPHYRAPAPWHLEKLSLVDSAWSIRRQIERSPEYHWDLYKKAVEP